MKGKLAAIVACLALIIGMVTASSEMECLVCEWSLAKAENFITSNSTEMAIESVLDRICHLVPEITQSCITYVKEYFPYLVSYLLNKETPAVICEQLNFCSEPFIG